MSIINISKQKFYTRLRFFTIEPHQRLCFWLGRFYVAMMPGLKIEIWSREWWQDFSHKSPNVFKGIKRMTH